MGKFGHGAFKVEKKKPFRKYSSVGPLTYTVEIEEGKTRLSYDGKLRFREKLKEIKAKKELAAKSVEKRKRHELLNLILKKPISFKTSDGKRVRILRQGFGNICLENSAQKPRALVIAFVNGKKLYFYRSSGMNSKRPGEWFPALDVDMFFDGHKYVAEHLVKAQGHPYLGKYPSNFPKWTEEIRQKIKSSEGKIVLSPDWGAQKLSEVNKALGKIPITGEIKVDKV